MSAIFRQLSQSLENVGLTRNARKCASYTIVGVGKRKTWYCDSTSYLVDRGVEVRGMAVDRVQCPQWCSIKASSAHAHSEVFLYASVCSPFHV